MRPVTRAAIRRVVARLADIAVGVLLAVCIGATIRSMFGAYSLLALQTLIVEIIIVVRCRSEMKSVAPRRVAAEVGVAWVVFCALVSGVLALSLLDLLPGWSGLVAGETVAAFGWHPPGADVPLIAVLVIWPLVGVAELLLAVLVAYAIRPRDPLTI